LLSLGSRRIRAESRADRSWRAWRAVACPWRSAAAVAGSLAIASGRLRLQLLGFFLDQLGFFLEPLRLRRPAATSSARNESCAARQPNWLISGKQAMTTDTALRLEQWLAVEVAFWLNLQNSY
jgi:hypothetical protein